MEGQVNVKHELVFCVHAKNEKARWRIVVFSRQVSEALSVSSLCILPRYDESGEKYDVHV